MRQDRIYILSCFINHVLKNHGDFEREYSRGQMPINENDFINIRQIMNNPDNISDGGLNRDNKQIIKFEKILMVVI